MPRNSKTIIVFDFETTGTDPLRCEPVQLAGLAINPRTLEVVAGTSGKFKSTLMCPPDVTILDTQECQEAFSFNKIRKEDVLAAPNQAVVWQSFFDWVNTFNYKKTGYTAPIPAGKNITTFDMVIVQRLCERYKMIQSGKQKIFSTYNILDLEHMLFMWFENSAVLKNYKMDTLRPFFGLSTEGAHDAGVDVEQTAVLLQRFMRMHRQMAARVPQFRAKEMV